MGGQTARMNALVTGGGGFLGGAIARLLRRQGAHVTILGRRDYPQAAAIGIDAIKADLTDHAAIRAACRGRDVVFHAAALAGIWGRREVFRRTNIDGTRNVIQACRAERVPKLVYTSSPSVVFGDRDLTGVDESQPYPKRYLADYPATKAEAEQMVLAANDAALATVALRPHLIWGPGDPHLIPRAIARARAGRLARVGDGTNRVDITYIDNAAEAHVAAAAALAPGARCAGRAYFISQGEPVVLWDWLAEVFRRTNTPPVTRRISFRAAYALGAAMETTWRALRLNSEPLMTRFLATQLAQSHWFDIRAARRDFDYAPRVSMAEGLDVLARHLNEGDAGSR